MGINVLIVGGGGREHALGWKISQSPKLGKLFFAPGNGGTLKLGENLPFQATEIGIAELIERAKRNKIDFTIVGSEAALEENIVGRFEGNGFRVFGPSGSAVELETSKSFGKKIMNMYDVPTAVHRVFLDYKKAINYVRRCGLPFVIKADGLAGGKGAYICKTYEVAISVLEDLMIKEIHGTAGLTVVIEEFLGGEEISIHAISDGQNFVLFPPSQDYKAVFDGDKGNNTGGMGSITPVLSFGPDYMRFVENNIVRVLIDACHECHFDFCGCLYPGLKITPDGIKVLEINCRFGDPETQSYMRLLKTDLLDIFDAYSCQNLSDLEVEWHEGFGVCVVLASGGYPGEYKKGIPITGLKEAARIPGVVVFHAGTVFENGIFRTNGGRVLCVTAVGKTLQGALDLAYDAVLHISFRKMHYRIDIGLKSLMATMTTFSH